MQIEELLWFFPSIFIFCNSLMIGLLFLTIQSKNKKGNIYLGLFLLSISINLLNDFINEFDISRFIFEPFLFILPLLFFYLLVTTNKKVREWHYLLILPGVIHNLFLHFPHVFTKNTITIYETTIYLLEIILTVYAFKILQNHYKSLSNYYSDFEYKTLKWLKSIFVLNVLIHFLNISTFIVDISSFRIIELTIDTTTLVLYIIMIYWIAYNGFSQPEIFKKYLFSKIDNNVDNSISQELKKATSETETQQFKEIKDQIQKRELFINPKLNLTSLSRELNIKEKELSRLINKQGGLNFHQFINGYRIQKFKILLESPKSEHLSLFGLAQESGFNSKSSFYQVFKALEGKTPKQYQLEHNKSKRKNSDLL